MVVLAKVLILIAAMFLLAAFREIIIFFDLRGVGDTAKMSLAHARAWACMKIAIVLGFMGLGLSLASR